MWLGSENQIKCILLRHGRTPSNETGRYLGQRDEPLSQAGIARLLEQKEAGFYPPVDGVVVSPLKRCGQTAELLWSEIAPKEHIVIPEFREIDFGKWDGKHYRELSGDAAYQSWIDSHGEKPFPEGESKRLFIERVMRGWERLLEMLTCDVRLRELTSLGLVVHGGTLMALGSVLCGGDYYDYQIANGCGYEMTLHRGTGQIGGWKKRDFS
ncbi:MAG: histidine phosphatase family protein [Lachnospiraceae bacterium]|nr:histidine phosphatase family protein [Lachnospiraceae bacterium]